MSSGGIRVPASPNLRAAHAARPGGELAETRRHLETHYYKRWWAELTESPVLCHLMNHPNPFDFRDPFHLAATTRPQCQCFGRRLDFSASLLLHPIDLLSQPLFVSDLHLFNISYKLYYIHPLWLQLRRSLVSIVSTVGNAIKAFLQSLKAPSLLFLPRQTHGVLTTSRGVKSFGALYVTP